jgi:serpin B
MMVKHSQFHYAEGDGLQALELPYAGGQLSMLILLPEAGKFDEVQASLSEEKLDALVAGLQHEDVRLWLPKFKYEYSLALNDSLKQMGMTDAFDDTRADFSGMDGARDLYIGAVLHKAFVAVDEAGTEAAAATVVIMQATSAQPGSPIEFRVDRPFFFLIRDNSTGTILFLGRVMNPAK